MPDGHGAKQSIVKAAYLSCVHIRLVLQVCNVSRQVAAGWCHAELVLKQQLLLQLGIVLS